MLPGTGLWYCPNLTGIPLYWRLTRVKHWSLADIYVRNTGFVDDLLKSCLNRARKWSFQPSFLFKEVLKTNIIWTRRLNFIIGTLQILRLSNNHLLQCCMKPVFILFQAYISQQIYQRGMRILAFPSIWWLLTRSLCTLFKIQIHSFVKVGSSLLITDWQLFSKGYKTYLCLLWA